MSVRGDAGHDGAVAATPWRERDKAVGSVRGTLRRAAVIFVPLAAIGAAVLYLLYQAQVDNVWSVARTGAERTVALCREVLSAGLGSAAADSLYLSEHGALRRWVESPSPAGQAPLASELLAFMRRKSMFYDQIGFIDAEGREIVRISRSGDAPAIVPQPQLRQRVDRPIVGETLKLDLGRVYVSPFELSAEDGAVEQPAKPLIRLGTPVFDAAGHRVGLIVVDYLGQRLLGRIRSFAEESLGHIWLLNADGYWLLGPTPEDEWGFMYADRRDRSFARSYPQAWQEVTRGPVAGQFVSHDELLNYAKVPAFGAGAPTDPQAAPSPTAAMMAPADAPWIVIGRVSAGMLDQQLAPLRQRLWLGAGLLLALFVAVAWLGGQHWAQRRAAERAVRDNEEQFRSLIELAPDAVIVIDEDGIIRVANVQAERLFGYRRDEMLGSEVEMLVPERFRNRHSGHRRGYIAAPRLRPMGVGLQLAGRRKDGSQFPVAISLSPIRAAGRTMIFCDIRDTTEQIESERKIRELNDRLTRDNASLETVNRELEAFSYSVSHDLRAPLRAIDGFSQALQEDSGASLDEAGRGHLRRVRMAAQRMGMLIDDLLTLARVSRAELSVAEVDLSAIGEEILSDLADAAPGRSVEATVQPGLTVRGDARLLRVALENLLGNAWKFSTGRDPARIAFGREADGGEPAYFVSDNGAGFDMAHAGKLFGAFQRLHDIDEFPGTGIGLATVQRIVHRHGGTIWAEAEPGAGATFRFTIDEGNL